MPDWSTLLRPELADLSPYAQAHPNDVLVVRLDANESPPRHTRAGAPLRDVVLDAISRVPIERYPDANASELKERIAERTGARARDLLVGSGSDEIIALIVTALSRPRRRRSTGLPHGPAELPQAVVLVVSPTFVMYRVTARAHGLKAVEVPLDATWDIDLPSMKRAIDLARPNIVFVASPNNPTGNRMDDDRLASLIEYSPDVLVVVDEAYVDYAGESVRSWRARFPQMAVLRTLSKVGLAALRVGWLEADEALVREIDKVRQPYNVSAISQAAAAAVLADGWAELRAHVAAVVLERDRVARAVCALPGFDVTPSQANFLWIKTAQPAAKAYERLLAQGIVVRSFHEIGGRMADRLRVTIGTPSDNDRFLEALAQAPVE